MDEINRRLEFLNTPLELRETDFEQNSRLREHFKLMLNAGLGKLAQRRKTTKNFFACDAEEILKISNEEDIVDIFGISENLCNISTSEKSSKASKTNLGILSESATSNPILYALITARTRILLHQNIEKLRKKNFIVYYCDCDSLIFAGPKDEPVPLDIGACFGQFRPQFGSNCSINSFISHGRKNYKISIDENGQKSSIFKLSGLSLDSALAKEAATTNYPEFFCTQNKKVLDKQVQKVPQVRHTRSKELETTYEVKNFTMRTNVVCQRRVDYTKPSVPTYPWGYCAKMSK